MTRLAPCLAPALLLAVSALAGCAAPPPGPAAPPPEPAPAPPPERAAPPPAPVPPAAEPAATPPAPAPVRPVEAAPAPPPPAPRAAAGPSGPPAGAGIARSRERVLETRRSTRGSRPEPGQDAFYDPSGDAFSSLQKANQALAGFPVDRRGAVDWMEALASGLIAPRADLAGQGAMALLETEILMTNTREMPHVRFPHLSHTRWLACSNCHDRIFVAKKGANPVNMEKIFLGEYCGVCHDKVAFSTFACERCHSVPHPGSPAKWW